ncbi:ATP-binding protein [Streptomyces carminius]|uniref:ATP-binding protein n=1 Tax=Streptomyces carminius TaxID=2665496 RepID=UPI0013046C73|nr:ATP-binding protein [Streptomyces carminius]
MSEALPRTDRLTLADTPNAVAWARRYASDVLLRWGVPKGVVETAHLLVSELTTNAIRHARPGPGVSPYSPLSRVRTVILGLRLAGDQLLVLVEDGDPQAPVVRDAGAEAAQGRGLFLVTAMSRNWGYYFPDRHPGKIVWAELSLRLPHGYPDEEKGRFAASGEQREQVPTGLVARTLLGLREL